MEKIELSEYAPQARKSEDIAYKVINGKKVPKREPERLPEQPNFPAQSAEEVIKKLRNIIPKREYLNIEDCMRAELDYFEYKIATDADLAHNDILIYDIEQKKAKLRGKIINNLIKSGRNADAYKLLAKNDEERAKLNARTEVKEDTSSQRVIKIEHK